MNQEEITTILQVCLFALAGDDMEEVIKFSAFRPDLVRYSYALADYLKEKEIREAVEVR